MATYEVADKEILVTDDAISFDGQEIPLAGAVGKVESKAVKEKVSKKKLMLGGPVVGPLIALPGRDTIATNVHLIISNKKHKLEIVVPESDETLQQARDVCAAISDLDGNEGDLAAVDGETANVSEAPSKRELRKAAKEQRAAEKADYKAKKKAGVYLEFGPVGQAKIVVNKETGRITYRGRAISLAGAQATADDGTSARFTATRMALAGPFALAAKKKSGHNYVTVESTDGVLMMELSSDKTFASLSRKWAADINNAARKYEGEHPTEAAPEPTPPSTDAFEALKKLGELRDAGILTDAEFEAKKTELLGRL